MTKGNHRHQPPPPPEAASVLPIQLPDVDLATLTEEWSEIRVALDPRVPPDTQVWRRRTADGYLTCLVGRMKIPPRPYVVQLAHTAEPSPRPLPDGDPEQIGRPPTVAELCDVLNRFTPRGTPLAVSFVSAGHPAPQWPQSVTLILIQNAPNIEGEGIHLVSH